jgi:hypothetical protein
LCSPSRPPRIQAISFLSKENRPEPTNKPTKSTFSNLIQDVLSGRGNNNSNSNRKNNNNGYGKREDNDFNPAIRYTESHANTSHTTLFTSALSFLNENSHCLSADHKINLCFSRT